METEIERRKIKELRLLSKEIGLYELEIMIIKDQIRKLMDNPSEYFEEIYHQDL